jgi:subtilisin family serine protease
MDQAAIVHRIPEAWSIAGDRQGGAGVKIGIIDTGIDPSHPAFDGSALTVPEGYPKVDNEAHLSFTGSKIIAARSYADMFEESEEDRTPRDHVGHGTATAMAAAGISAKGALATVSGVAPRAWLGVYRVFGSSGVNDSAPTDAVLKAIDDAVADGMDVINMSFGSVSAPSLDADIEAQAVERASAAGVIVVVASGNNGGDLATVGSPATAPSAITVGAVENRREFAAAVSVPGASYRATPGTGLRSEVPLAARLRDVTAWDPSGLLCEPAPASSLTGQIAFIFRGTCTFEVKLNHARNAGAVGAVIYTSEDRPVVAMSPGTATLPAVMISNADGVALKAMMADSRTVDAEVDFTLRPFERAPYVLTSFTSKGPGLDGTIKPEVVAVGKDIYVATQREFAGGDMYDASGFLVTEGTSFSSPIVAGIAALLKAARPGLTVPEYRSLLVNSAMPLPEGIQSAGAGSVDAESAMYSRLTFRPATLSFGSGSSSADLTRRLHVRNVTQDTVEYLITVVPQAEQPAPVLSVDRIAFEPGSAAEIALTLRQDGLAEGAYQGYVIFTDPITTHTQRVPYWFAVQSANPARITVLYQETSGRSNTTLREAVLFRVTGGAGVDVAGLEPAASVQTGTGSVVGVTRLSRLVPGVYSMSVRLSRGENVFRITAGPLERDVSLSGN